MWKLQLAYDFASYAVVVWHKGIQYPDCYDFTAYTVWIWHCLPTRHIYAQDLWCGVAVFFLCVSNHPLNYCTLSLLDAMPLQRWHTHCTDWCNVYAMMATKDTVTAAHKSVLTSSSVWTQCSYKTKETEEQSRVCREGRTKMCLSKRYGKNLSCTNYAPESR